MPIPAIPAPAPLPVRVDNNTSIFTGEVVATEHLVRDVRENRLVVANPRPSFEAGIGMDLFCGIWGTSSDRRCSTANTNLLTDGFSTSGYVEYCDGWWRHMQTRYNTQFSLAWNGAVAGDLWADTAAKITSDFADINMPHIDFAFIRPGGNDIANGATAASISASIQATVEEQFLSRGIKVVLIVSHTYNPMNTATFAQYEALATFFENLATLYPGLIMVANTYEAFGAGSPTSSSYLLDTQHLNEDGVEVAIDAFEDVCRVWGRPCMSTDPYDYGEVIMEIDPNNTTGLTVASATQTNGTSDIDKKKRILLTNTANGGRVIQSNMVPGKTLRAGDLCRIWCDVTPEAGTSTSSIYMAGAGLRNSIDVVDAKRFGTYSSGSTFGPQIGNRIRGLSLIFTVPMSLVPNTQLYATAGAGTNSAYVGRIALIRVKKAVESDDAEPMLALDPISSIRIPDPRKGKQVTATLIRGTVSVGISNASELLVFGSNTNTTTNSMSTSLMDASITKAILTEGAALSSAMVSIPHPIGESASVIATTNAAGFAVTLGE